MNQRVKYLVPFWDLLHNRPMKSMIDSIAPNRKTRPESFFFGGIMIIRGLKAHAITEWHPILSTLHTTLVQKTYCMSEGCDIFRNKTVLSWMSQCTISNHFISKSKLTLDFEILPEKFQWKHHFFWGFYFEKEFKQLNYLNLLLLIQKSTYFIRTAKFGYDSYQSASLKTTKLQIRQAISPVNIPRKN